MKQGTTAAAIGAVLLIIAGCGGSGGNRAGFGDSSGAASGNPDLTGTWDLSGLSASGKSVACPVASGTTDIPSTVQNVLTVNNVEADRCILGENIVFSSGNKYTITYPAPRFLNLTVDNGDYSVNGTTLTLTRTSRGFDLNNDGIIAGAEVTTVSPSQKLTASIRVQNGMLAITGQNADSSADIPTAVDGSVVTRTYTKRMQ